MEKCPLTRHISCLKATYLLRDQEQSTGAQLISEAVSEDLLIPLQIDFTMMEGNVFMIYLFCEALF